MGMKTRKTGCLKPLIPADQVQKAAMQIKLIDLQLMSICSDASCPPTLRVTGPLAAMQRTLRRLRYEIEVEGGFDTPAIRGCQNDCSVDGFGGLE